MDTFEYGWERGKDKKLFFIDIIKRSANECGRQKCRWKAYNL